MISKKALLISYLYPPISGMAPRRMNFICNELIKNGYESHVLTCKPMPNHPRIIIDNSSNEFITEKQVIFRSYQGIIARLIRSFPSILDGEIKECYNQGCRPFVYKFIKSFLIPDSKIDWAFFALNYARQHLKNNTYSLIISHGYPMSCHIIALLLKTFYFKDAKWIADYGEPWSLNHELHDMPIWRRTLDQWLENKCLSNVDAVIVNTEKTKTEFLKKFPFIRKNSIYIIPSCFIKLKDYNLKRLMNEQMLMVYTGNIYFNLQNPFKFFKAVSKLKNKKIKIVIAGNINNKLKNYVTNNKLEHIINFVGFKGREEVIRLQRQADVLLLFGAFKSPQIPSKIYEYIAAKRPILCIRFDPEDNSAKIIKKLKRGIIVNNNEEEIQSAIEYFYNKWVYKEIDSIIDLSEIHQYSQEGNEEKIKNILKEIFI